MVIRHGSAGVPARATSWTSAAVVNAGDGWHEHPTQALLDCYAIRAALRRRGGADAGLDGLKVLIIGDIKHSRVARSDVLAFSALGAEVELAGPPTLLPPSLEGWPCSLAAHLETSLASADVVYVLRIQAERAQEALLPSLREYTACWGLTRERASLLAKDALVMHPGPMNRGVEIAAEVADSPASLVTHQVHHGIAVRMAVLFDLVSAGGPDYFDRTFHRAGLADA